MTRRSLVLAALAFFPLRAAFAAEKAVTEPQAPHPSAAPMRAAPLPSGLHSSPAQIAQAITLEMPISPSPGSPSPAIAPPTSADSLRPLPVSEAAGQYPGGANAGQAGPAEGPGQVSAESERAAAGAAFDNARPSVGRTLDIAIVAGTLSSLASHVIVWKATTLDYTFHSNYEALRLDRAVPGAITLADKLLVLTALAPIAEEVLFRAGIMGAVSWLVSWVRGPAARGFWGPALISSLIFVPFHETGDPLLMGTRLGMALMLAWAYHSGGLLAAIAAHSTYNLLQVLPVLAYNAFGHDAFLLTLGAQYCLAGGLALSSLWSLLRRRAAAKASRVGAYTLSGFLALTLALVLALGALPLSDRPGELLKWFLPAILGLFAYRLGWLKPGK